MAAGQTDEERVAGLGGTALAQVRAHQMTEVCHAAGGSPLESGDTRGMTDVPQPPDGIVPDQPQEKKPFIIPFHASIQVASCMQLLDEGVELLIDDQRVVVPVTAEQRLKFQQQPPEPDRPQRVSLWFRTAQGRVQDLECFNFSVLRGERAKSGAPNRPQFSIGALFKGVDREEGSLVVEVKPNPTGQLLESFELQLWAAPHFLNRHFYTNQTYLIHGRYDPVGGQLIATEMRPMMIGTPLAPGSTKRKAPSIAASKSKKWKGKKWKEKKAKAKASAAGEEAPSTPGTGDTPTPKES